MTKKMMINKGEKMKNLVLLITLLITYSYVNAEEKAPKPFTNSNIERKLENGKLQKFDGNKYMIVKRGTKTKPKVKVVVKEKLVQKKNAVKLFIGHGPENDITRESQNRVSLERDAFLGIGYQRMLNEEFSLEVIGTTNESLMIGGGFHF